MSKLLHFLLRVAFLLLLLVLCSVVSPNQKEERRKQWGGGDEEEGLRVGGAVVEWEEWRSGGDVEEGGGDEEKGKGVYEEAGGKEIQGLWKVQGGNTNHSVGMSENMRILSHAVHHNYFVIDIVDHNYLVIEYAPHLEHYPLNIISYVPWMDNETKKQVEEERKQWEEKVWKVWGEEKREKGKWDRHMTRKLEEQIENWRKQQEEETRKQREEKMRKQDEKRKQWGEERKQREEERRKQLGEERRKPQDEKWREQQEERTWKPQEEEPKLLRLSIYQLIHLGLLGSVESPNQLRRRVWEPGESICAKLVKISGDVHANPGPRVPEEQIRKENIGVKTLSIDKSDVKYKFEILIDGYKCRAPDCGARHTNPKLLWRDWDSFKGHGREHHMVMIENKHRTSGNFLSCKAFTEKDFFKCRSCENKFFWAKPKRDHEKKEHKHQGHVTDADLTVLGELFPDLMDFAGSHQQHLPSSTATEALPAQYEASPPNSASNYTPYSTERVGDEPGTLQQQVEKLQQELQKERREKDECQQELQRERNEKDECQQELQRERREKDECQKELRSKKRDNRLMKVQLENKEEENQELRQRCDMLEASLSGSSSSSLPQSPF